MRFALLMIPHKMLIAADVFATILSDPDLHVDISRTSHAAVMQMDVSP